MESTPVSRASLGTRHAGMSLQSCRRMVNLDAVSLVLLFKPFSSDKVGESCLPFSCVLTGIPMG
jgi:hypothetical protein